MIIIDSDSPTRDTLEQLSFVNARQPRPIVLFTEDRDNETIQAALQAGVSAYIVAGMQPDRLQPILDVAVARFAQERALRAELRDTQEKLAERKLIERAKGLVMKQKSVDEEEAYRADAQARDGSQPQAPRGRAADHRRLGAHGLMRFACLVRDDSRLHVCGARPLRRENNPMKLDESSVYRLRRPHGMDHAKGEARIRVDRGPASSAANGGGAAFDNGVVCVPGLRCASEWNGTGAVFHLGECDEHEESAMDESMQARDRAATRGRCPHHGGACSAHRRPAR